jgi:hypothetical protein
MFPLRHTDQNNPAELFQIWHNLDAAHNQWVSGFDPICKHRRWECLCQMATDGFGLQPWRCRLSAKFS